VVATRLLFWSIAGCYADAEGRGSTPPPSRGRTGRARSSSIDSLSRRQPRVALRNILERIVFWSRRRQGERGQKKCEKRGILAQFGTIYLGFLETQRKAAANCSRVISLADIMITRWQYA